MEVASVLCQTGRSCARITLQQLQLVALQHLIIGQVLLCTHTCSTEIVNVLVYTAAALAFCVTAPAASRQRPGPPANTQVYAVSIMLCDHDDAAAPACRSIAPAASRHRPGPSVYTYMLSSKRCQYAASHHTPSSATTMFILLFLILSISLILFLLCLAVNRSD